MAPMPHKSARRALPYPPMLSPNLCSPDPGVPEHRYVLAQLNTSTDGANPLVVLGMNPSYADEFHSDETVNRVANARVQLGYSGWAMLNLYPERATRPADLHAFDKKLSVQNCAAIEQFLMEYGVREIFGAWGNLPNATIRQAKPDVLTVVVGLGVRVFYFGRLTTKNNPRHLKPRHGELDLTATKHFL